MKRIFSALYLLIAFALGITFIYSAYTKTLPIQSFEYTIVEFTNMPWLLAAAMARALVGLEAALGLLIAIHFFGSRKWVLKTALALLAVFSIYLIYLWAKAGNNVNCGCFGDRIWMSPSSSLLKNAVMIILLLLLIRFHKGIHFKWSWLTDAVLFLGIITSIFFVFPIPPQQPHWLSKDNYPLDLSPLYAPGKKDAPSIDLHKGKYVIAFFSLACPHCRMAALKMQVMKTKNPALPFYMVLAGDDNNLKPFFEQTKAYNIPHTRLEKQAFLDLVGYSWPVIDWVNNDTVVAQADYVTLSQQEIENWLSK